MTCGYAHSFSTIASPNAMAVSTRYTIGRIFTTPRSICRRSVCGVLHARVDRRTRSCVDRQTSSRSSLRLCGFRVGHSAAEPQPDMPRCDPGSRAATT